VAVWLEALILIVAQTNEECKCRAEDALLLQVALECNIYPLGYLKNFYLSTCSPTAISKPNPNPTAISTKNTDFVYLCRCAPPDLRVVALVVGGPGATNDDGGGVAASSLFTLSLCQLPICFFLSFHFFLLWHLLFLTSSLFCFGNPDFFSFLTWSIFASRVFTCRFFVFFDLARFYFSDLAGFYSALF
jgi:hypothetical protein